MAHNFYPLPTKSQTFATQTILAFVVSLLRRSHFQLEMTTAAERRTPARWCRTWPGPFNAVRTGLRSRHALNERLPLEGRLRLRAPLYSADILQLAHGESRDLLPPTTSSGT
jgi:hypothetical protein